MVCSVRALLICSTLISLSLACGGLLGGGCGGGCGCGRRKKRSIDMEWVGEVARDNDMLCNSVHLKEMINQTLSTTSEASKIALTNRLTQEGDTSAVVVCSEKPFTYAVPAHAEYCSHGNHHNVCHVFIL